MPKVAVIGTTSWGTTLAVMLARKPFEVVLWARTAAEAETIDKNRENQTRLPGVAFPKGLQVTADPDAALEGADLAVLAVPSQRMRENIRRLAPHVRSQTIVLSAAKGLELGTLLRMSQVIQQELGAAAGPHCGVLSGPNISREVALGMPAATVVAAADAQVAERARDLVMTPAFRVYSSTDLIGVELGGTLKNIIALGAGMNDGWGYGANSKAAFMTRGLHEIIRLGVAAGAQPLTFLGLAGLGDMLTTCASPLSRNRRVGEALAQGRSLPEVLESLGGVAEGPSTVIAARDLAHRLGVEMPILEALNRVLYEGLDPKAAIANLMSRDPKDELEGLAQDS